MGRFDGGFTGFRFREIPTLSKDSAAYEAPIEQGGGFAVRAQLFRPDGTPVDGSTWAFFNNWEKRVRVTKLRIEERGETVPDLAALPKSAILGRYEAPLLRGPIGVVGRIGLMSEAVLRAPGSGEYEIAVKTQSGHASLYLDLDGDGKWSAKEKLITDTPSTEKPVAVRVQLAADTSVRLRVDHRNDEPRPVLIVTLDGPGTRGKREITPYLQLR